VDVSVENTGEYSTGKFHRAEAARTAEEQVCE